MYNLLVNSLTEQNRKATEEQIFNLPFEAFRKTSREG